MNLENEWKPPENDKFKGLCSDVLGHVNLLDHYLVVHALSILNRVKQENICFMFWI